MGLTRRRWHTLSLLVLVAILALPLLPATGTDAYVTALSRTGAVSYSDYLGGSGSDAGWGIAVDNQGNAYVTGQTSSGDFPTTPYTVSLTTGASSGTCPGLTGLLGGTLGLSLVCPVSYPVQTGPALTATATLSVTLPATGTDAFVVKVSADGSSIGYSQRLGSLGGLNAIGDTWGRAIAVDGQGNAYVTGQTDSPDFPVTTLSPVGVTNAATLIHGVCNPLTGLNTGTLTQVITTTGGLCYDAFVTKLSPSYQGLNGRILYSTYLGGGRDDDGYGIATDGRGNAYVTGRTDSPDFPTTTGGNLDRATGSTGPLGTATYPACHETSCPDAFAARLDTTAGGLITAPPAVWQLTGPVIADVTSGVGGLLGLPVAGTAGTIVNGPTLTWSRFLGGSGADEGTAVALDPSGNVYVAGDTAPPTAGTTGDFSTPGASDPATATTRAYSTTAPAGACPTGPCADAFVAKLSNTSSGSQSYGQLLYASRVGGGGDDRAAALAVDTAGHAYVVGSTSSADYPLIGSLQGFAGTATGSLTTTMAVVTKLNTQGSALWYSSYLGGSGGDAGSAVAVDGIGDVALAGATGSADFLSLRPVARQELATQPTQTHLNGSQGQPDAFVATIDATTRYLTYGYDNVDRLTGVTETLGNAYAYSYDPAGNRTDAYLNGVAVQHSQYDSANEAITVTTPTSTTIDTYDAAGNLTADSANSYRYDPLNRLIALTPSGPTGATGQPAQPETYAYNGDGTLVAQTAGTGNNAVTTRYTQDLAIQPSLPGANGGPSTGLFAPTGHTPPPSQVLQARVTQTSGGDLVTDYAYGVDPQGNPARFASNPLGGGAHTWYVVDPQGSPRYTQDDSGQPTGAGTPAGTLNYDPQPVRYAPYGAIDRGADGNGQVPQTFGYRGELQDANTGLVNLRARTYNPATGQFLTRDPLEQQTGQAYAYAGANPINHADPTGQAYDIFGCASGNPYLETAEAAAVRNLLFYSNPGTHVGCNVVIPGDAHAGKETVVTDDRGGQLWVVRSLDALFATPSSAQEAQQQAVRDVAALRSAGSHQALFTRQQHGFLFITSCTLVRDTASLTALHPGTDFNGGRRPQAVEVGQNADNPPVTLNVGQFIQPSGGQVPGVLFYQGYTPVPGHSCITSNFSFLGVLHCGYQFLVGDDLDALRSNRVGFLGKAVAVVDLASNALLLVPLVGEGTRGAVKGAAAGILRTALRRAVPEAELRTLDELGGHAGAHLGESEYQQLDQGARQGEGQERPVDTGLSSAGIPHTVEGVVQALDDAKLLGKTTATADITLGRLELGLEQPANPQALRLIFNASLDSEGRGGVRVLGRRSVRGEIEVNPNQTLDDVLGTVIHEGRHDLDDLTNLSRVDSGDNATRTAILYREGRAFQAELLFSRAASLKTAALARYGSLPIEEWLKLVAVDYNVADLRSRTIKTIAAQIERDSAGL